VAAYHFDVKVFSRGKGHAVVQKAAYRSGQKLYDETSGHTHDFTKKRGVIHTEILTPEHAPEWMRDRQRLWNAVEFSEGRMDSQLAREVELAIPRELSAEARFEVVREFVRDHFVSQGMVADVCWHAPDSDKPHAHIMLTMRAIDDAEPTGFGKKVRAWNKRELVLEWRGQWAEYGNRALEREGHLERIDHRSYRDRGIALQPQPKLGRTVHHSGVADLDRRGGVHEAVEDCARIARANGERIAEHPSIVLDLLTSNQSVFSREQMLRALNTHTADVEQFNRCLAAVMASPELVPLHADTGPERFTTRDVLAAERRVRDAGHALAGDGSHKVADAFVAQAIAARPTMNPEQQQALAHLTRDTGALALLEGYAGTGKSFMLDAAREAWEAQGLTVVGGALAGKAAEGLEESSGIPSRTLASWIHGLDHGTLQLTAQHVLVIDESGMVGTRQMGRLLEAAQLAGAKVVLVGDSRQLEAIEAGSPFHMLATEHGAEKLTQVMRQRTEWMREATKAFGDGEPAKALAAYHANGKTHAADTHQGALKGVAEAWARHHLKRPGQSSLMLAYKRDDVHKLNAAARKFRVDRGELGAGLVVQTEYGQREFSRGDRIYFGLNDKREIGVTNGSLGTVEAVRGSELLVKLDGGRLVVVDTDRYKHLDHGYAVTVHKSQGVTVDRVFAVADDHWRSASAYVAMSRHRDSVDVFWSRDQFRDQAALDKALCRASGKGMAHDLLEEAEAARVAELAPRAQSTPQAPELSPAEARARRRAELLPLMEAARARATSTQEVIDRLPEVVEARARVAAAEKELHAATETLHKHAGASWLERLRGPSREDLERAREEAIQRLLALRGAASALVDSPDLRKRAEGIAGQQNEPLAKVVNELQELARADVAERDAGRALERGRGPDRDPDRGGRGW
jgi:Ti-type conjugative transfer relaxase TraA